MRGVQASARSRSRSRSTQIHIPVETGRLPEQPGLPYRAEHWPTGCSGGTGLLGCWAGLPGLPGVALASKFLGCVGCVGCVGCIGCIAVPVLNPGSHPLQRSVISTQSKQRTRGSSALALALALAWHLHLSSRSTMAMADGRWNGSPETGTETASGAQQLHPSKTFQQPSQTLDLLRKHSTRDKSSRLSRFRACPGLPPDSCLLI